MRCLVPTDADPLDWLSRDALAALWILGRMAELGLRKPLSTEGQQTWARLNGTGFQAQESEVRAFLRALWGPELETTVRAVLGITEQEAA